MSYTIADSTRLQQLINEVYRLPQNPRGEQRIAQLKTGLNAGAQTFKYRQVEEHGEAKLIAPGATDLPSVGVKVTEYIVQAGVFGNQYEVSTEDMRSASMAGESLDAMLGMTARKAHDDAHARIALYGDGTKFKGLLNTTNIPKTTALADGTGNATTFASKTPTQILDETNGMINAIAIRNNQAVRANTLIMDGNTHSIMTGKYLPNTSQTLLETVQKAHPYINDIIVINSITAAERAKYIVGSDIYTGNIMIAYNKRNQNDGLAYYQPLSFFQHRPQQTGLNTIVPCESKTAGMVIVYPREFQVLEGI